MEKFYVIQDKSAKIILGKNIYPLISVKKSLANFFDQTYAKIEENGDNIVIYIQLKDSRINIDELIGELYNEFLRESLRYEISLETKNLRELIVGRALYTTCIQLEDDQTEEREPNYKIEDNNEEYDIEEIARNWFDKYDEKEDKKC